MSDQPKMSELMRAAARGVMTPYDGPGQFDTQSFDMAQSMAGMFDALAEVYEAYEKTSPPSA